MSRSSWRLLDILERTSRFFATRGMESARLQAELLLADVLNVERIDLYLQFDRILTSAEVDAYREHVRKRLDHCPIQYITGRVGFRHLILRVSGEVLIPRPETEILVETALDHMAPLVAPRVLDLGCGSGAIAVSIAHEYPTASLVATDISAGAVEITRQNAVLNRVEDRLKLLCGDLFQPLRESAEFEPFDFIVSNPPYVRTGDIPALAPEVREYEPRLALDGGEDGLKWYRRIAKEAGDFLVPGGRLILEIGDGQAEQVRAILEDEGFSLAEMRRDLSGIHRVVVARIAAL